MCDGKPVFGLPGQPVSALNTFRLFVAPVVRALSGRHEESREVCARLAAPLAAAPKREEHVRVALQRDGAEWTALPLGGISAQILSMVRADGLVRLPVGHPGHAPGDAVTVLLLE
jgi:molybdopterin molybdotransferase